MSIFSICKHTVHASLSQEIENQQITSLKYTVVLPRLRQNDCNMVFGMLVAGTSENE